MAESHTDSRRNERITWWILGVTVAFILSGMAYSLFWPLVVRHVHWYWLVPGDLWSTVRGAHFIGWGGLSFVYVRHTALITLPGFDVLLMPAALMDSAIGLAESAPGLLPVPKPDSWLLLGPYTMALVAVALFGADALARRLGARRAVRRLIAVGVACASWPAIAFWGHPEDVVALGLVMFAMARALNGKHTSAAWILGSAVAMQLFAVIFVPVFVGLLGVRKGGAFCTRAAVIPLFFLVAVLVPDFHHAWSTLTNQPNYPTVNHATPWVAIAPKIARGVVAAGPPRIAGFVLAGLVGVLVYRRRNDPRFVVWSMLLVMVIRAAFETVFVPYYVMPAVVLAFVSAATNGNFRRLVVVCTGVLVTITTHWYFEDWGYWLQILVLLGVLAFVTWPSRRKTTLLASADLRLSSDGTAGVPVSDLMGDPTPDRRPEPASEGVTS